MLKQTEDRLVWEVPLWARGLALIVGGSFVVAPAIFLLLPPSSQVSTLQTLLTSLGCIIVGPLLLSAAGKTCIELDFATGRYSVVYGFPFIERHRSGIMSEDIGSLYIEGDKLWVRWKQARRFRFYLGLTTNYDCETLARKMKVPLATNQPVPIDRSAATLLRASQRVDRDLLQPSDDPQLHS